MSEEERLQLENECLMKYSKAQMIQKYIDELEESSKLSELWCKSQEENKKYKKVIDKAIKNTENFLCTEDYINVNGIAIANNYKELLEILKGDSNE